MAHGPTRTVLLLGASGFIGGAVAEASSRLAPPGTTLLAGSARGKVTPLLDALRPDAVINAAGLTRGTSAQLREANVDLVERLLEATEPRGIRLVHVGSAAELGRSPDRSPLGEDAPASPITEYGHCKLQATERIRSAHRSGADAVVLRLFNVAVPQAPAGSPLAEFRQALAAGEIVIENARTARDYVTIDFVAQVLLRAACAPDRPPTPVVNLCSGRATTFGELAKALGRASGLDVVVRDRALPIPLPLVTGDPSLLHALHGLREHAGPDELARAALGPMVSVAGAPSNLATGLGPAA